MCTTTKSVKGVTYNTNMCTWVRGCVGVGVGGWMGEWEVVGEPTLEHMPYPPSKPTNVN